MVGCGCIVVPFQDYSDGRVGRVLFSPVSRPSANKNYFAYRWSRYAFAIAQATRPPIFKNKNPRPRSGIDEVKYASLLLCNRNAHMCLPTMRGLSMMMVVVREY